MSPTAPVLVSGTQSCETVDEGTTDYGVGGTETTRGMEAACVFTMSDPRASGSFTFTGAFDCYFNAGTQGWSCVGWTDGVLTGPDGTWEGGSIGVENAYVGFFTGTGAYEGLTFAALSSGLDDTIEGVIYEGPPPPWALPAAMSE